MCKYTILWNRQNTTATSTIKHWQFDVVEMLTVDSGTKMDIAKTLHVNSTVGPDATVTTYSEGYIMLSTCTGEPLQ